MAFESYCLSAYITENVPVVVHASWKESDVSTLQSKIWFFTCQQDAKSVVEKLPMNERERLRQELAALPVTSNEASVHVRRGVASLFAHLLANAINQPPEALVILDVPGIAGFWGPPANSGHFDAAILWYTPDDGYHGAVVYSKKSALEILESFAWLSESEHQTRLRRLATWGLPETSATETIKLSGAIARALNISSAIHKNRAHARSKMN